MPSTGLLFPGGGTSGRRKSKFGGDPPDSQGQQGKQGATSIMFWLYYLMSGLKFIKHKKDLNWVDRLAYHWSTVLILCCAFTVTAKQYVGMPLQCWVPATFTSAMEQYAENYCWSANTYFVQKDKSVPLDIRARRMAELTYYQWVPFLLVLQAVVVTIPCIIWRAMYWQTGYDIAAIVEAAAEIRSQAGDDRKRLLYLLCNYIYETCMRQNALMQKATGKHRWCSLPPWYRSCYVTVLYCVSKFLCLCNCILQLTLLNVFLQMDSPLYGIEIVINLVQGIGWESSGLFPRVTMCDFRVRVLGNIQRNTIQCVLVINMFNEKIFVVLWFWFFFLMILVGYNLICLLASSFSEDKRLNFIERYYVSRNCSTNLAYQLKLHYQREQLKLFLHEVLQYDGILVLKNVAAHAGEFVCSEAISMLYEWHEQGEMHSPGGTGTVPVMNPSREPSREGSRRRYKAGADDQMERVGAPEILGQDSPDPVRREFQERRNAFTSDRQQLSKSLRRKSKRRGDSSDVPQRRCFSGKGRKTPKNSYFTFA